MEEIKVESHSKINIGLNVVDKREDGFHNLQTVFYPLLLSDKLTFQKSNKLEFNSNSDFLKNLDDNLIIKAIKLIEVKSGVEIKVKIFVEKLIPIGGGLGGGSSNAAAALKAINKLFSLELNYEKLAEITLELGSDVPFFLKHNPAYAESRGEKLFPLNLEIQYPIVIVNPGINISTRWAFERINPSKPNYNLRELLSKNFDFKVIRDYVTNDFEPIVFKEYPVIEKIKKDLYELGANFALMSGTGSTVYGIFSNLQKAYWAEEHFKQSYFTFINNPFNKGSIT
ncbi:MAG: 4-(cytidine 5'-diphospho)-2-C-methyl-D-erythritol kinase [Ignavibacteriaceae bacterium]|nr:4-(cytidine 5'-diphospho)-2-C-methyl-D-erythritol kinase [Ignavibacteriaceae bacterium]